VALDLFLGPFSAVVGETPIAREPFDGLRERLIPALLVLDLLVDVLFEPDLFGTQV
jgi:hypothetical protein